MSYKHQPDSLLTGPSLPFQPPFRADRSCESVLEYLFCIPKVLGSIASTTERETKGYQRFRLYPSTGEAGAGGSKIQDQPELHSETVSQKEKHSSFMHSYFLHWLCCQQALLAPRKLFLKRKQKGQSRQPSGQRRLTTTLFDLLEPTWWREKTDNSCRLSSDHMYTVAYLCLHTCTHNFFFQDQGLTMQPWLTWNLLYRPGQP